jgi:hypothetical protein
MIQPIRTLGQWLSTHPTKTYAGTWEPVRKFFANTVHTLEQPAGWLGFAENEASGAVKQWLAGEAPLNYAKQVKEPETLLQHLCAFGFNAGGGSKLYNNPAVEALRKVTSTIAHVLETATSAAGATMFSANPWFFAPVGIAAGSGLQTARQTVLNQLG